MDPVTSRVTIRYLSLMFDVSSGRKTAQGERRIEALLSLLWHYFLMHMYNYHCLAISLVLDVHAVNLVSVHIITA